MVTQDSVTPLRHIGGRRIAYPTEPRQSGAPWEDKQFRGTFSQTKNRAGLRQLHFHDLRGTAITILCEAGCTERQIGSITGHSVKRVHAILEKYMARTRALNVAATQKLEETWISNLALNFGATG